MNKKLLIPTILGIAFVGMVSADDSTAMQMNSINKGCSMTQKLTEEQKTKLDSLTTKEEKMAYMKSIMNTGTSTGKCNMGEMKGMKMGSGSMMEHKEHMGSGTMDHREDMGTGAMNHDMKEMKQTKQDIKNLTGVTKKAHNLGDSLIKKVDKLFTSDTDEITALNKIISKVDTILANSSITDTNKEIYTHLKKMLNDRITELQNPSSSTDIDIDSIFN